MTLPRGFLDELRARVSIVDVVARKVKLTRRGREHIGLCPFHSEKTPSFTVSADKGFYHCFGCGAHGDAVSFEMRANGLSFMEAVERLAASAGMAVPESTPEEAARSRRAATVLEALEAAARFYEQRLRLPEGTKALSYARGRGLAEDTIARFRLGYAPPGNALRAALMRDGWDQGTLAEAGLIGIPDDGRAPYDILRDRLTFPISDRRGRAIAFGGRILGDGQPKYLNSPETALFHKGGVLYGLAQARAAAFEAGRIVVVEGYMDVIGLSQAGLAEAVAPLGTALTEGHLSELWRICDEPILCFDGDAAGVRAAHRAAERALPLLVPGRSLRFAGLPEGKDPDELILESGKAAMEAVLTAALPLAELLWRGALEGRDLSTPERRAALERDLAETCSRIGDETVRTQYRSELKNRAWALFHPPREAAPGARSRTAASSALPPAPHADAPRKPGAEVSNERDLAAGLLIEPGFAVHHLDAVARILPSDPRAAAFLSALLTALGDAPAGGEAERIEAAIPARVLDPVRTWARRLNWGGLSQAEREGRLSALVATLRYRALGAEIEAIRAAMAADPSPELWTRFQALKAEQARLQQIDGDLSA